MKISAITVLSIVVMSSRFAFCMLPVESICPLSVQLPKALVSTEMHNIISAGEVSTFKAQIIEEGNDASVYELEPIELNSIDFDRKAIEVDRVLRSAI